jgi:protein arginine kinase activator
MLCDDCKEREATVTLTRAEKGDVSLLHLCPQCASARGYETTATSPLKDLIADYLPAVQQQTALAQAEALQCPFCSMMLRDFRQTGRLGCANCYTTFEQSLRELLRRVHGNSKHVGRRYSPPPLHLTEAEGSLGELRERLRLAVESEQFELAAMLRDQIKVIDE